MLAGTHGRNEPYVAASGASFGVDAPAAGFAEAEEDAPLIAGEREATSTAMSVRLVRLDPSAILMDRRDHERSRTSHSPDDLGLISCVHERLHQYVNCMPFGRRAHERPERESSCRDARRGRVTALAAHDERVKRVRRGHFS